MTTTMYAYEYFDQAHDCDDDDDDDDDDNTFSSPCKRTPGEEILHHLGCMKHYETL